MYERLPIPDCPEALAFRTVVNVIGSGPTLLAAQCVSVIGRTAHRTTCRPRREPGRRSSNCSRRPSGTGWAEADQHRSDVGVGHHDRHRGPAPTTCSTFAGVLRSALFPEPALYRNAAVERPRTSIGVFRGELVRQPFQVVSVDAQHPHVGRRGTLKLRMNISTQEGDYNGMRVQAWLRLTRSDLRNLRFRRDTAWIRLGTDRRFHAADHGRAQSDPARGRRQPSRSGRVVDSHGHRQTLDAALPDAGGRVLAWATTLTSNELSSYRPTSTTAFASADSLGGKVDSLDLSCDATQGERAPGRVGAHVPNLRGERPVALEPPYSSFPTTTPYVFKRSSTGFHGRRFGADRVQQILLLDQRIGCLSRSMSWRMSRYLLLRS